MAKAWDEFMGGSRFKSQWRIKKKKKGKNNYLFYCLIHKYTKVKCLDYCIVKSKNEIAHLILHLVEGNLRCFVLWSIFLVERGAGWG